MSLTTNREIDAILDFWFGPLKDGFPKEDRSDLWWKASKRTDQRIEKKFGALIAQATNGELDEWAETPEGLLALILLLDQFPRNVYRGQREAYKTDAKALEWCKHGLAQYMHTQLPYIQRVFFYLPLEHSEDLQDQDHCVELFEQLMHDVDFEYRDQTQAFLEFAIDHRDIIERFGRFPHRNETLGRKGTPAEKSFLEQGGQSFGQN